MRCIFHGCDGHDDQFVTIAHGLDHLADRQDAIIRAIANLDTKVSTLVTTVDQVAADFAQYKQDVADAFARLAASIAAGTTDPAALDALDAAIKGADADAVAEDATPLDADGPAPDATATA